MFDGSTWVVVAAAAAESLEAVDVGWGAVIVTTGAGVLLSVPVSGPTVTPESPPAPDTSTVTGVACGSEAPESAPEPVTGVACAVSSGAIAPPAGAVAPFPAPESCPLTLEADEPVPEFAGAWSFAEAVVVVEPSPAVSDSLGVAPGGEFATGV